MSFATRRVVRQAHEGTKHGRISMTTRKALTKAVGVRYRGASRSEQQKILDEVAAFSGRHRKHAIGLSSCERVADPEAMARNRIDDEAAAKAPIILWRAADRVCGKRLKVLVPLLTDAMQRRGHLDLDPIVKDKVGVYGRLDIHRAAGTTGPAALSDQPFRGDRADR
jgi:hypothetical protein